MIDYGLAEAHHATAAVAAVVRSDLGTLHAIPEAGVRSDVVAVHKMASQVVDHTHMMAIDCVSVVHAVEIHSILEVAAIYFFLSMVAQLVHYYEAANDFFRGLVGADLLHVASCAGNHLVAVAVLD